MRAVSVLAMSVLAGSLVGFLPAGSALAADSAADSAAGSTDCSSIETPVAQLLCRDAGLSAASVALEAALSALGDTTDVMGRAAIEAEQTLWRTRRDEGCPVTTADLADDKLAKSRSECLSRVIALRIAVLNAQRMARGKPVADLPLVITDAAAPRLVAVPPRSVALTRPVSMTALVGRWAKADPINGTPIDDCRTSYLDVTREQLVHLVDPRVPGFPIVSRITADPDPVQGAMLPLDDGAAGAAKGTLKLEAADTPRRDRLILRLEAPATFAATFVRCR